MKGLLSLLRLATEYLEKKGIDRPRREAEDLLGHVLQISRLEIYLYPDKPLTEAEVELLRSLLRRRALGEPTAYLIGSVSFHGCTLRVTPDVLIPRPETEILVALAVDALRDHSLEGKVLLDLCTGSGCIAIALKKRFPSLRVWASDISSQALAVAQENAKNNDVSIEWKEGDFLDPYKGEQVDFVTCNPPYVSEKEWESLDPEVRLQEPRQALVGGERGDDFYQRLARELPSYLVSGGKLWMEMGYQQAKTMRSLFQLPVWKPPQIIQDWSGHDRFAYTQTT